MNIDEFFDFLRYTPRVWTFGKAGNIVNGPIPKKGFQYFNGEALQYIYPLCPITAVRTFKTGEISPMGAGRYKEDGRNLGLSDEEIIAISKAADKEGIYDPALRVRLLEACDLIEKPE